MIVSDNPAKFANELKKIYARFDTNDSTHRNRYEITNLCLSKYYRYV